MADFALNLKITAIDQFSPVLNNLKSTLGSIQGISKGMDRVGEGLKSSIVTNKSSFFGQATFDLLAGTGRQLQGLGSQISGFVGQMRASRGATEEARNALESVGMSAGDLDMLEGKARSLGEAFGIMPSNIMAAQYALKGGMGFLGAEALAGITEISASFAAATKSDMNTTTSLFALAGNALAADLQGTSEEQQKAFAEWEYGFANAAANVVNIAMAEGDQIAAFTSKVGPALKNLGNVGLDVQMGMAGVLITATGSGDIAATQAKNIASQWPKAINEIKKMGIEVQNSDGSLRSMIDVMAEMKPKLEGMDAVSRSKFMQKAFASQATIAGVNNLMNNWNSFTQFTESSTKAIADGQAAYRGEIDLTSTAMGSMASAFQKGPLFSMEQLKVKQQNLFEDIGKTVAQTQSPVVQLQAKFTEMAQGFVKNNPKMVGGIMQIAQSFGGGLQAVGGFMGTFGNIGKGIESAKLMFSSIGQIGSQAGQLIKSKWAPILLILGLIVAAIMSDKQMMAEFMQLFKEIGQSLAGAFKTLMPAIKGIINALKPIFPILIDVVKQALPPLLEMFKAVLPIVMQIVNLLTGVLGDVLTGIIVPAIQLIADVLKTWWPFFKPIAEFFQNVLITAIKWVFDAIEYIMQSIPDFLLGNDAEINKYTNIISSGKGSEENVDRAAKMILTNTLIESGVNTDANLENLAQTGGAKGQEFVTYTKELDRMNKERLARGETSLDIKGLTEAKFNTLFANEVAAAKNKKQLEDRDKLAASYSDPKEREAALASFDKNNKAWTAEMVTTQAAPMLNPNAGQNTGKTEINQGGVTVNIEGNASKETIDYAVDRSKGLLDENGRQLSKELAKQTTVDVMRAGG